MIDSVLVHSPVQPVLAARSSRRLVILAYHGIRDQEQFAQQMEFISREMRPVTLGEALEIISNPQADPPKRAVLVTFDDADRTLLERGLPVLQQFHIPAVAFVIAGYLNSSRPFWWREVEQLMGGGAFSSAISRDAAIAIHQLKMMSDLERRRTISNLRQDRRSPKPKEVQLRDSDLAVLDAEGIAIGNHTVTHPLLDRCTHWRIHQEIQRAHRILFKAVGSAPVVFAYPNGNWHPQAVQTLQELGYRAGFLFDHRVSRTSPPDRFRVSRVRVGSATSMNRFRLIVSGLHPMIHHAFGRP